MSGEPSADPRDIAAIRSLQVAVGAAAACGFCGYFAAKSLGKPFADEATRQNGALMMTAAAILVVVVATVYAMICLYRGGPRAKIMSMFALLVALGGSFAGWTLGWKKAGDPSVIQVI